MIEKHTELHKVNEAVVPMHLAVPGGFELPSSRHLEIPHPLNCVVGI